MTTNIRPVRWDYVATDSLFFKYDASVFNRLPPKNFSNEWITIAVCETNGALTVSVFVKKGYACDGPTGVPDLKGTVEGAFVHDPIYQFSEDIAYCWHWPMRDVLSFGDVCFRETMRQNKTNAAVREIYYRGVCLFGYRFHSLARWWNSR